jgi:hypothetical protein
MSVSEITYACSQAWTWHQTSNLTEKSIGGSNPPRRAKGAVMTFYIWFMDLWGRNRHNPLTWEIYDALRPMWVGNNYNQWLVEVREAV